MGSDESHFNVSLIARGKVTGQSPQTTTFEEKGQPKRNRTEVLVLTSLTPVCQGKPCEQGGGPGLSFDPYPILPLSPLSHMVSVDVEHHKRTRSQSDTIFSITFFILLENDTSSQTIHKNTVNTITL